MTRADLALPSDLTDAGVTARSSLVLPCRCVVERFFASINRNRRLAKDVEQTIASAITWLFIASIQLCARRVPRL